MHVSRAKRVVAAMLAIAVLTTTAALHSGAAADLTEPDPDEVVEGLPTTVDGLLDLDDLLPPEPEEYKDFDQLLVEVADEVPQFGGFFLEDENTVNIWLTGPASAANDDRRGQRSLRELAGRLHDQVSEGMRIRVLRAQYSWHELHQWFMELYLHLEAEGVNSFDIDDARNRLAIGVTDSEQHEAAVRTQAAELGIPAAALEVVEETASLFDHHAADLRSRHRPVVGGLQVGTTWGSTCTAGLAADRGGVRGFITASHCTTLIGGPNDGDVIGQPTIAIGNELGRERRDGQWWTTDCPTGRLRRYADTTFFDNAFNQGSTRGRIAWPPANGSIQWDGTTTRSITAVLAGEPAVNANVAKVGRTTGRSFGAVKYTCRAFNHTWPAARVPGSVTGDVRYRCISYAEYARGSGDSGAPVFR